MYWIAYLISALGISYLVSNFTDKPVFYFLLITIMLITPAQIVPSEPFYAPSIFTFLYSFIFEGELSLRPLRPLALTLPIFLIFGILFYFFKRRFF